MREHVLGHCGLNTAEDLAAFIADLHKDEAQQMEILATL